MTDEEKQVRNALYRAGLCVWCGQPQSAGRPRCDECHSVLASHGFFDPELDRTTPATCGICKTPDITKPGRVTCAGCQPNVGKRRW